ncbi:MAG TPA: NlpC/P60 family protein [Devosiaceae bacterium]|jgi:NlpC/P60 family putative phage cell wall peptidase|nr:NlpC/P60 family protein [Devosiaceae bacterium]
MRPAAEEVVAAARAWLGTPYRHRASVRGAGCDCLGLLRGVWRSLYGSEPLPVPNYRADARDHAGSLQRAAERLLVAVEGTPQAGDVVLFRLRPGAPPRHCGIIVGPLRFIHAQEGLGVVEASIGDSWQRRLAGLYRFPEARTC